MQCPKCKSILPDNSICCNFCGWKFDRRRYEVITFENESFENVQRWFNAYGDQIQLKDAYCRLRFAEKGFLLTRYYWYFEKLTIQYYPGACGLSHRLIYCYDNDRLFHSAKSNVNRYIQNELNGKLFVLDRNKDGYLPGGAYTYCRVAITAVAI